jgi:Tfp pilus assembly protein PilX
MAGAVRLRASVCRGATLERDAGIGLVEVLVSMLLFGLVLIMTVGVMVSSLRVSAHNSTIASATQWASERTDLAHTTVAGLNAAKACAAWTAFAAEAPPADKDDARGVTMRMLITASTTPTNCTTSSTTPVVSYTVKIVQADDPSRVLASTRAQLALGLE